MTNNDHPCPHCGSTKDTWFSRTLPMGDICPDCGLDVANPPTPPPGSQEALDLGCLCPVVDNCHGRGVAPGIFVYREDCPVHYPRTLAEEVIEKGTDV
jgi:hypothetical protein